MTNRLSRSLAPVAALVAAASVALLALALLDGEAVAKPQAPDRALTMMSYNIHTGIGMDRKLDLQRTADEIRASGAEAVGLQEVDVRWSSRSNFEDQAKALAEELDMNYFFAPIYSFDPTEPGGPRREYGLAILSEYPILSAENHDITRLSTQSASPTPEPAPGFPEVVLNVRGVKVHFYDTHLDYRADPTVRRMQVDDMLEIMAEDDGPKVLAGDLNAPPEAPELARLFEVMNDSWMAQGDGSGYTYPAGNPTKRIDYVLTSPDVGVESVSVPDTLASDHRPVVAELSLPGEAVGAGDAVTKSGR